MENNLTTIEINGVKLEIDLRQARRIETLTIGSKVKLLSKKTPYQEAKVYAGVVVGFEPFKELPTIIVAYLKSDWNSCAVEFAYINANNDAFDMVASVDDDLMINKTETLTSFERQITLKRREIEDLEAKRDYFLSHFGKHFEPSKEKV